MTRTGLVLVIAALAFGSAGPAAAQPVLPPAGGGPSGGRGIGPPPPPPPSEEREPGIALREPMWVSVRGEATGPFEPPVIMQKIEAREIIAETQVYTRSLNRWVRAGEVAALQPLLQRAAASPRSGTPAPPGPDDREEAARFRQYMLGEWEYDGPPEPKSGAPSRVFLRYRPDGTYRGYITHTFTTKHGDKDPASAPMTGKWAVKPVSDRRFLLRMDAGKGVVDLPYEILDDNRTRDLNTGVIAIRTGF